ncbi:MAG TPA: hybrid sensor histidine kinase/response regulator [Cyanobacteria bacterium UBA11049]|nr:hybrid sensor histidine kinase/response regulator [Cyanobacteria bacterium UBA11049]
MNIQNQLEKKSKYSQQWLNTILASISDAAIATDERNCITLLNPAAELLTGWKKEDAVDRQIAEVLCFAHEGTHNLLELSIAQVLVKNVALGFPEQAILITKNGTKILIEKKSVLLEDEQGQIDGIVVVFRDITPGLETEKNCLAQARTQQLEAQMAELERLSRLKDDFLSTVSHELRTPMANITMAVKMLELSLGRIQERLTSARSEINTSSTTRYLQILKDECGREINLIENILDLQRLEAGVQTFDSENIHFQTWLPQVVEPFQERANNRQQTLQVDIPANLPTIVSDLGSVGRILAELLNNACKYTPPGENITLTARAKKEKIQLQVCNSGVEIPQKELPRVFDKFYRIPSHDPWKQGGTGLGLALVQKLSEQLGGGISAESGGGKTCFTVELPLKM